MLFQWLLSIALSAEIIVVGIQGYVLLTKLNYIHNAITQELSELRFIVGYFKTVLHQGVEIGKDFYSQEILVVRSTEITRRYYLTRAVKERGFVLWVQEGNQRSEVLSHDLKLLRLKFCRKLDSKWICQSSSEIQDWHQVKAVEFDLEFFDNAPVDTVIKLKNHHQWRFVLLLGK